MSYIKKYIDTLNGEHGSLEDSESEGSVRCLQFKGIEYSCYNLFKQQKSFLMAKNILSESDNDPYMQPRCSVVYEGSTEQTESEMENKQIMMKMQYLLTNDLDTDLPMYQNELLHEDCTNSQSIGGSNSPII